MTEDDFALVLRFLERIGASEAWFRPWSQEAVTYRFADAETYPDNQHFGTFGASYERITRFLAEE